MNGRCHSTRGTWRRQRFAHADVRFLIFAKAPVEGLAKTRLIPALGATGAARLQAAMIEQTLQTCLRIAPRGVELWCAPKAAHPFFDAVGRRFGVLLQEQQGTDLGERMLHALSDALLRTEAAVLLGTDAPTIRASDLRSAAGALRSGTDVVLAPALDGGYVLIGVNRVDPRLFDKVEWSSPRVLAQTRERLRALNYRWRELRAHRDIDRPEDWAWLLQRAPEWAERLKRPLQPESSDAPGMPRLSATESE